MVDIRFGAKGEVALKKSLAAVMKHFTQVKVVHHLPGRLRLYVPLLERLSSEWRRYQSNIIDIVELKEGIVDIEMSIVSGRVLIMYDPERTSKSQILEWFKDLALMLYEGYADAPFESKRQILPFLKKMRAQSQLLIKDHGHVREIA